MDHFSFHFNYLYLDFDSIRNLFVNFAIVIAEVADFIITTHSSPTYYLD